MKYTDTHVSVDVHTEEDLVETETRTEAAMEGQEGDGTTRIQRHSLAYIFLVINVLWKHH